ncbi:MAG: hypothetical protein KC464_27040 [Myxococcales bacterium]|nr:hypothetical protein [Myxococcales bacterium]
MDNATLGTSPLSSSGCTAARFPIEATASLRARAAACRHQHEPGRRLFRVTWAPQLVCAACLHAAAAAHRVAAVSNGSDRQKVGVGSGDRKPTLEYYDRSARWRAGLSGDGFVSVLDPAPDGTERRARRGRHC